MGRSRQYNPKTGKWSRPRPWYDHRRGRKKKDGCYIATCIYGSYDCPQVWILRRYRDNILGKSWYGRLFIIIYYAISPIIINLFGKTNWFKHIWKSKLDKIVYQLNQFGIDDTPYNDIDWRK